MDGSDDFYAILGVERDADSATIRQAFKKLALTYHPDKVSEAERPQAEVRFKVISEAYEVLSNEERRMLYDAQTEFSTANEWQDFYAAPQDDAFFDFDSPFTGFGPQFYSGTGHAHPRSSRRTEDAVFEVELTLEDVYKGKMLKLSTQRQVLCRRCDGSGGKRGAKKRVCNSCKGLGTTRRTQLVGPGLLATSNVECPVCSGEGQVYRDKDVCRRCKGKQTQEIKTMIEVYIPKGVKNRHRIVIEGHADEEPRMVPGDLVILVLVNAEHATFRREGADLYATAQISLKEALTGFSRSLVTHLDGRKLKPTVPRGDILKPGSILKIAGEGLVIEDAAAGSQTVGDLYLQIETIFPDAIDPHILDKLATLLNTDDDAASERSDDTLDEARTYDEFYADFDTKHGSDASCFEVDVPHELMDESNLPEYHEDMNDEFYAEETDKDSGPGPEHRWRSSGSNFNGSASRCTVM